MSEDRDDLGAIARTLPYGKLALEGLATAGQPSEQDLKRLAEAGVRAVVDLRAPDEPRGFDEAAVAREVGLRYENLPVAGPPSDAAFEEMRRILADRERHPMLLHCASANRVGAMMIPYLVLDQGKDPEEALRLAEDVGLRSRELADRALEYVARNRE